MIEGIASYEEIYSETLSKEDMATLDALGVEWRGRNIHDIQDDLHLKTVELAGRVLEHTAQKKPQALAQIKADLVELFQVVFGAESDEEDKSSSLLYRYDPISGTYQEVTGTACHFKHLSPSLFSNKNPSAITKTLIPPEQ